MHSLALDVEGAKKLALVIVGVLVLLAVVFALLIRWIVGKVIAVVLAVVLATVVFLQRDKLSNDVKDCDATFFGVHLTVPDSVKSQAGCAR